MKISIQKVSCLAVWIATILIIEFDIYWISQHLNINAFWAINIGIATFALSLASVITSAVASTHWHRW